MSRNELLAFITLVLTLGFTISTVARAWLLRGERRREPELPPAGVEARLARIEHAVEAIAIEVERVSEGQRFTTKLLAERESAPPADGRRVP